MKKLLLCLAGLFSLSYISRAQCTPVDCSASLPVYGGVCDTLLMDGNVNQLYSDFESFVLTDNCFDAGLIDPSQAGNDIRITNVDNFTFGGLPNGISVVPNQSSYQPPSGSYIVGCALFSGTPTEAGIFQDTMYFLADVLLCVFPIASNDNAANYVIWMTIFPDPSFTGLAATYCETDASAVLTPTGTTGGTFSGPGVTGSTFDPSIAGVGTHTIWYVVSAQEGLAVAPATDSSSMTVAVTSGTTYYVDVDLDDFGDVADPGASFCTNPGAGYSTNNTDCDDGDGAINPGATEVCDGVDNNCNSLIDDGLTFTNYYVDGDGDGFGAGAAQSLCANPGAGYVTNNTDCDDNENTTYPGAPELCDGVDNDCNSIIDDNITYTTYYVDGDGDSYGDINDVGTSLCTNPGAGYSANNTDCNDADGTINPGATEVCDGIDNNCNSLIDDGLTFTTYYVDGDGDSYGDINDVGTSLCTNPGAGYSANNTDCNDGDIAINPGATEVCDGVDNNCNSIVDDGLTFTTYYVDLDGDNYGDMNDAGNSLCANPGSGYSTTNDDCDDTENTVYPGASEITDNGIDENCDGVDGYLALEEDDFNPFLLFPNPSSSIVTIKGEKFDRVTISDLGGKNVMEFQSVNKTELHFDVETLINGIYLVQIKSEAKVKIIKFIKQ